MIILFLLINLFWVAWGYDNALIWGRRGADSFKFDEHWFLLATEILLLVLVLAINEFKLTVWDVRAAVIAGAFTKPFFKDGAMYSLRDRIDGSYPGGWFANPSKTSTSLINFSTFWRVMALFVGVTFLVYAKLN